MRVFWLVMAMALAGDAAPTDAPVAAEDKRQGYVKSVYDGDTVTLESGDKIRLKWANAPELHSKEPCSVESRDETVSLVMNRTVDLTVDPDSERDGYGRLLAAVSAGGTDLSLDLIEKGLAHVYIIPPLDGDPAPYLAAQAKARDAGLCIWSSDRFRGALHITSFHANGIGDETADPNKEYLRIANVGKGPVDLGDYRIANVRGDSFQLPHISVPEGYTVRVHSGKGGDVADVNQQLVVHLQSDVPVWSNTYDKAVILAKDGSVVDAEEYHGHED